MQTQLQKDCQFLMHYTSSLVAKINKGNNSYCRKKANFFSAPEKQELEFKTLITVPEGIAKEQFEKWLDRENNVPVHAKLTLEEEETELMQEIVANDSASGPEVVKLEEGNSTFSSALAMR